LFSIDIKYHPETIVCTDEHPFYVREKTIKYSHNKRLISFGDPVWKKANELTINDYFGMVINNRSIIPKFSFEKIINQSATEKVEIFLDKEEYWFMMGYFVGDGWIEETMKSCGSERSQHMINFVINNIDEHELIGKVLETNIVIVENVKNLVAEICYGSTF
jgi:hypothetical protein